MPRKQIPAAERRIPQHLHKKRGPKPYTQNLCICSRLGIIRRSNAWICAWCAAIEESHIKRIKTTGMTRRRREDFGGLETYAYSNAVVES